MFLTKTEADAIDARVAAVESRTGVQIVTAVVGKSDTYVELPWKAFALGARSPPSVSWSRTRAPRLGHRPRRAPARRRNPRRGRRVRAARGVRPAVRPPVPARARGATSRSGSTRSRCSSRASSSRTRQRTGVLVLVSLFERRIEILPDTGLHGRVTEADWHAVIAAWRRICAAPPVRRAAGRRSTRSRRCSSTRASARPAQSPTSCPIGRSRSAANEASAMGCPRSRAAGCCCRGAALGRRRPVPDRPRRRQREHPQRRETRDAADRRAQGARSRRPATRSSC